MSQEPGVWPPEIAAHRRFLWGLARLQLGNEADADDVVQDTLLAAARSWDRYATATPLRAWLTGILKHKIIDALRGRRRDSQRMVNWDEGEDAWAPDQDFTPAGAWDPATFLDYQCPESRVTQGQLLDLVEVCLRALPERAARFLLMREYLGMDSDEIATEAGVTPGNLRVILHRSRLQLRRCVVHGWGEDL